MKYKLPVVFVTNTRSARYKLDDLATTAKINQADILCVTESWFSEYMPDEAFHIPGYSPPQRHDRQGRQGGGVAVWVHNDFNFKVWHELKTEVESLWLTIWSNRMPRTFSHIAIGVIYHPDQHAASHTQTMDHIYQSVEYIRGKHPHVGLLITGDFNQLPDYRLKSHLQMKQLVKQPTRGNAILDKVFTNLNPFYSTTTVTSHIGTSDHRAVVCYPHLSKSYDTGRQHPVTTRLID